MKWLKWFRHQDVHRAKAAGWIESEGTYPTHHDHYSMLMVWPQDGEPPESTWKFPAEERAA